MRRSEPGVRAGARAFQEEQVQVPEADMGLIFLRLKTPV